MLAEMRPDVAVVACYPRLIPRALRAIPAHGGINIHPSLLPRWRGPDPLFWTLRQGDGVAGVTVHALTGRYDAGPIYAQRYVPYADGTTEAELDVLLARTGSELALRVISQLCQGRAQAVAQADQNASYAPWPEPDDFELDLQGSARSAFNFARGISQRGHPITITLNGKAHEVRNVLAWWPDDAQPPGALPPDASVVAFSTGQLAAHIVPMPATHTLRP